MKARTKLLDLALRYGGFSVQLLFRDNTRRLVSEDSETKEKYTNLLAGKQHLGDYPEA